jgi:hypothetical protein
VYPAGHPRIAWALHELGATLVRQGQFTEARTVLLEAVGSYVASPVQEPPRLARAQGLLAAALTGLRKTRAADSVLTAADRYFVDNGRERHPDRVDLLLTRASLHAIGGDLAATDSVLAAADALIVDRLSDVHPKRARVTALRQHLMPR